ncbi:ATP-binding protein [Streptomyces doebereineriae]|uniref:ATP-binding protein n=1 Tax=Streptomyces doebereineriae TaxID=3075528 RepID=UPI00374E0A44
MSVFCASVREVVDALRPEAPCTFRTRIEVTDPDPRALPVLLRATVTEESGRGLALLDAMARRWGVEQGADRKTVWCELEEPGQRPPCHVQAVRAGSL